MAFAFEKLLVYQKSVDFYDLICDLTEQISARYNHLADQGNRASLSIACNVAEDNGSFTKTNSSTEIVLASWEMEASMLNLYCNPRNGIIFR
jgi:four helix bundle protein